MLPVGPLPRVPSGGPALPGTRDEARVYIGKLGSRSPEWKL